MSQPLCFEKMFHNATETPLRALRGGRPGVLSNNPMLALRRLVAVLVEDGAARKPEPFAVGPEAFLHMNLNITQALRGLRFWKVHTNSQWLSFQEGLSDLIAPY